MFEGIKFAYPEFLLLLILVAVYIVWYIFRQKANYAELTVSSISNITGIKPTFRQRFRHLLLILRIISYSLLVIALARPQTSSSSQSIKTEGIDIVITLDVSTSMLAEDFKPNRIEAAKKTALEFIDGRPDDRIGLVVFAGESFTQCPLTIDHDVLKNLMTSIKSGMIEDGTAIGMGLGTAISRLKDSDSKSKVIILLTDGVNNTGNLAPVTAGEIAATFGIRVYTIGVGTRGKAPYPMQMRSWTGQVFTQYQNIDVQIDEDVLKKIASATNGKYFRATNNKALENIYNEIDKLEKTKIDVAYFSRHTEKFLPFAILAALFLIIEIILKYTYFRSIP